MGKKYNLTDYEIMCRREDGKTIKDIAQEAGVSYSSMYERIKKISKPGGICLYDTMGDGKGGIWIVIEITDNHYVLKNQASRKVERISRRLFSAGETMYHKLDTPPVKVYNLNDPPKEKAAAPAEEVKEPAEAPVKPVVVQPKQARRKYLARIESILDAVKPESRSESQYLYDLVSEIFRNGFDAEFMMEGDKNDRL